MKRRSAPKQPIPIGVDPLERLSAIGRGILFVHLLVTPLLFTQATIEGFEFIKFLGLITTVLLLLVVGAFALPYLSQQQIKLELRQPLTLAGLAFVASALISTIVSTDWRTSFYGHYENYTGFVTILSCFLLFVAARVFIRTPEQMHRMLLAVAIAAGGVTAYGLLQAARLDPLNWSNLSTIGGFVRPFSTFGHANFLGAWLVLALPLVVFLASGRMRIFMIALGLAMVLLLILSMSRGAWLGLAGSAFAAGIYQWRSGSRMRKRATLIVIGCLIVVIIALFLSGDSLRTAIASRTDRFLDGAGRTEIWSAAGKMFLERPLVGTGPDTFHHHFGRHHGVAFWEHSWGFTPTRVHNEFLHILATQGALGFLTMLGVLVALGWTLVRAWRQNPGQRGLIAAITAALCGFLITELFGFTVIACGSLAVVLGAMVGRLGQQALEAREALALSRIAIPWRIAQGAVIASCGFLFVHLVTDPLRADVHAAAAQLARTPDEALHCHQEAVRICPRVPLYWSRLAGHAEVCGRWEADERKHAHYYCLARQGYAEAAAREPGNGYHRAGLGRTIGELAKLGQANPNEAFRAFDEALQRDPSIAFFYVDASQAAMQLGKVARAENYVRSGLERYPLYGMMLRQAAMLLLLHNRPTEAVPEFDRALTADWKGQTLDRDTTAKIRDEVIRRIARNR